MKVLSSRIFKVIILNIIVLGTLMLFFTPAIKVDDYYMAEILYGATSGVYDEHLIYSNVLLGYFLKWCLTIFPGVAWFTVSQIIGVFASLLLFSYIVITRFSNKFAFAILIPVLYTIGYTGYIKITFTKTAAILIAVGIFSLFHGIYYWEKIHKKYLVLGVTAIFAGMLYRNAAWNMIFFVLVSIMAVEFCISLKNKKFKYASSRLVISLCAIVLCFGMRSGLSNVNHHVYSISPGWENFFAENSLKGQIVDYTTENYTSAYEKIGISENDLDLIYSNNILNDDEFMTIEKQEEVIRLANGEDSFWKKFFSFQNLISFFRKFFSSYFIYPCVLCVAFLMLVMCTKYRLRTILIWLLGFAFVLAENYYLYIGGRMGQDHVDIGMILAYCLYIIYFLEESDKSISRLRYVSTAFILGILGILVNYSSFASETYNSYGNDLACKAEIDKKYTDILTADTAHFYFAPSRESYYSKWNYSAFEIIPQSYYSNYLCSCELLWASQKSILSNYGIEHPFREMINSDVMFFVVSDIIEDSFVEEFQTYLNEHYADGEARFIKVKEMGYINVYRCIQGELELSLDEIGTAQTFGNASYSWENEELIVNADCYIKDTNSYETQYYLEIEDKDTKESTYYLMEQTESKDHKDIMNGQFSTASVVLEDAGLFDSNGTKIYVIMYDGSSYYRMEARSISD